MSTKIRIGFAGYSESFESFLKFVTWYEEDLNIELSGAWFSNERAEDYSGKVFDTFQDMLEASDAVVFFSDKLSKSLVKDAVKARKHIFVDDYTYLIKGDIKGLCKLITEAGIIAQVSFPKIYYWGIEDIMNEYQEIRNIFYFREYSYHSQKQDVDLLAEIFASIKLIGEEVIRADKQNVPMIGKRSDMQIMNLTFATGAVASITGIPVGFIERHDLRIISKKAIAYVDLRKREWHSLKQAKGMAGNLIKGLAGLPEVGDVEQFEIQDFISSIHEGEEPFVTARDMESLSNCLKLLDA